jgi:hypothetical protein
MVKGLNPHDIREILSGLVQEKSMRIKVINYTKDHKGCKSFIHFISQDSFALFTNTKFTKKTMPRQQAHITFNR